MLALLKWIFLIIILVLLGLVSYSVSYLFSWHEIWWAPWLVFVFLLGLIAAGILLARFIDQWRKRHYSDEAMEMRRQEREEKDVIWSRRSNLSRQWKLLIQQLKKSRFKTRGNPVYALPWFLMLGPPRSGKTAMIESSKLSVPFGDQSVGKTIGNCRWWLLEETLILDVPGSYAFHRNSGDKAEWRQFLNLLLRHRRGQPLNGVVLTLPADDIFHASDDELQKTSVTLRERLDDMVLRLGINFPVYLMITKCDQVQGLTKFFEHFPPEVLNQAMGVLNDRFAEQGVADRFLNRAFRRLGRRLDRLRLALLGNLNPLHVDAKGFIFPEEFKFLQHRLSTAAKLIFQKSSYHESPYFRAIYFSSAQQDGQPHSAILQRIGFPDENLSVSGGSVSFFIRDFFSKVLRRDRNLVSATKRAVNLQAMTNNVGALVWMGFCLIIGILVSVSFARNLHTTRQAAAEIPPLKMTNQYTQDLHSLEKIRKAIFSLQDRNRGWWIPRMALNHSVQVEQEIIGIYTRKFYQYGLRPADLDILKFTRRLNTSTDPIVIAKYIDLFSRRINLLEKIRVDGDREADAYLPELPNFKTLLGKRVQSDKSPLIDIMRDNYVAYLLWDTDNTYLNEEYAEQEKNLKKILSQEDLGLNWLVNWANIQDNLSDVTLAPYWGRNLPRESIIVPRAFTPKGWFAVNKFINDIQKVSVAKDMVAIERKKFQLSYLIQYFNKWQTFLSRFHRGEDLFVSNEDKKKLAALMASKDSPFRLVMRDAVKQLLPVVALAKKMEKTDRVPSWYRTLSRFQLLQDAKYRQVLEQAQGGVLGAVKVALEKAQEGIITRGNQESGLAADRKALPFVKTYISTIEAMADTVSGSKAALEIALETFKEKEAIVSEPKNAVLKNFWVKTRKLRREFDYSGRATEEVFWRLLDDEFRILWSVIIYEAQKELQRTWEEDVLADTKSMEEKEKQKVLQGEGGLIWQHRDKYTKPFIARGSRKDLFGEIIHFTKEYLDVLRAGPVNSEVLEPEVQITIGADPTDTNPGVLVPPRRTDLIIKCKEEFRLVNVHSFVIPKSFTWKSSDCGEVKLEIKVGQLTLVKTWPDLRAFMLDFGKDGVRKFRRKEFNFRERGQLTGYAIQYMLVKYKFDKGYDKVTVRNVKRIPPIPDHIIDRNFIKEGS